MDFQRHTIKMDLHTMNCKERKKNPPGSLLFFSAFDINLSKGHSQVKFILHITTDIKTVLILNGIRTKLDGKIATRQSYFGALTIKSNHKYMTGHRNVFPQNNGESGKIHSSASLAFVEKWFELLEMHSSSTFFSF